MDMDRIFTHIWFIYIFHKDTDAIVMRDISALFLLAPGITGVVGVYLNTVKMAHILFYKLACRRRAYKCQICDHLCLLCNT